MPNRPVNRLWFWAALALTVFKLWLTNGQTIFAIGPAMHDDGLFIKLAGHLIKGEWLGPYDQFTLAKGPMFSLFIAAVFWLGVPLILAQQLLYAAASATVTRALAPWLRPGAPQFAVYTLLLWNPMSFDAGNLGRIMRQNLYTPLALLVIAGLVHLFTRRREGWTRQIVPAALGGLALGCFWLTREESVWLLPAVGLIFLGLAASLGRECRAHWRNVAAGLIVFSTAALLPILVICSLNLRHYGWFGTVEFRAGEFKAAYGALTRLQVGPELFQVPVTRQMREKAYELSPEFRRLRPYMEGFVSESWAERDLFPFAERQIRGGWFAWALRDAVAASGLATDAGKTMRFYQKVADEVNAACDQGLVPALPPRSGFLPPLGENMVRLLAEGTLEYGTFFLYFKNFTAYSPESLGDYAELKPFRDLVGSRLSLAPRSPEPVYSTQMSIDAWKVASLDRLGRWLAHLLTWLGPLILLAGFVRAFESTIDRLISFPLGLAAALLAACTAYLTINVLVHVTSFYNMSPAALASAYPLYLLALALIVTDATRAWLKSPVAAAAPAAPVAAPVSRWLWLVPAGTALVVFAARLHEIHFYAGDVPFKDQWIIEAEQIIGPWLDGTLRPWTFFTPHFEHLPVWTRLLSWLQVVVTGRWDPLVQMTVNAGLHTLFVWFVTRWVWQTVPAWPAGFVTGILLMGGTLPHAWENIAWGFQSQFPLALTFLFLHIRGACTHPPGTRGWWLAQAAGAASLFTLASIWLAPLAVVICQFWTGLRDRKRMAAPLIIAATGMGLLAIIHWRAQEGHSFAQTPGAIVPLLHSVLHLLGWPSALPGAAAVVQLPWLIHALRLRAQSSATALDRIIFSLGLLNCLQAAALAIGRTGDNVDYVSRYGDLLFIGVLSGALALTRLVSSTGRARTIFLAGCTVWAVTVTVGMFQRSTEGHARYFHLHAAESAALRRTAVQAYLNNGDKGPLEQPETRWVLTEYTWVVTSLLDRPAFRALLPNSVNPATPVYAVGTLNQRLQSSWFWLLLTGLIGLAGGLGLVLWRGSSVAPRQPLAVSPDPWRGRIALAVGLTSTGLLFFWSNPLAFDQEYRARQLLGGDEAVANLTFEFFTPSPFGPERLQGAAPLMPVTMRNRFVGTAPDGPGFTGTVLGSPFVLQKPWLVVPYAGYPVAHGNGLRLRIVDARGATIGNEIGCPGPNRDGVGFWPVDVRPYVGRSARLVLYDGRTDTDAWVAAAPPIPSDSAELAVVLAQRLLDEDHADMHTSLGIISLVAFLCAGITWWNRRQ